MQEAVANCLPPLVPAIKEDAPVMVKQLLTLLLESENYGERKGAAYGLGGLVKGLGILVLKQLNIMTTLTEAIQNKKNPRHREGELSIIPMHECAGVTLVVSALPLQRNLELLELRIKTV